MKLIFALTLISYSIIFNNSFGQETIETVKNELLKSDSLKNYNKEPFILGERITMKSDTLDEDRVINIYLPPGYNPDSSQTYPVIYLLDGSYNEDFIHISGLIQFCTFPWINLIPEVILVGIENVDRQRDFTFPSEEERDKAQLPTSGGSGKFIHYLKDELKPYIDSNYATRDTSVLIGQSLGGLLATEILLYHPDIFDRYIIISPSLWWDDQNLLNLYNSAYKTDKMVYVGVGNEGPMMLAVAQKLFSKLYAASNSNIYFKQFKELNHGDVLHLAVYDAFEKMFMEDMKHER